MQKRNMTAAAAAKIRGSEDYPNINGYVTFRQMKHGVLVTAEIHGLPYNEKDNMGVLAFHIHNGTSCTGNSDDPFADADGHYNPKGLKHPYHAGDLPPLFSNKGYAYMSVFTSRFKVSDIIGRVIIIHRDVDDFITQPSGNAGKKIACGKIV